MKFNLKRAAILLGAIIFPKNFSSLAARYFLHTIGIGYAIEVYDSGEIRLLRHLFDADENLVLFDIGGNIGTYSRYVCENFKHARVHVFEPSVVHYSKLEASLAEYRDQCQLNNFGLSSSNEELILYKDHEITGSATLVDRSNEAFSQIKEKVKLVAIDDYISNMKIEKIDYIKIDVEGWEYEIIAGLRGQLESGIVKYVQFEVTRNTLKINKTIPDFFMLLNQYGYIINIIRPSGRVVPAQIDDDLSNIYMGTNYLAVRGDRQLG